MSKLILLLHVSLQTLCQSPATPLIPHPEQLRTAPPILQIPPTAAKPSGLHHLLPTSHLQELICNLVLTTFTSQYIICFLTLSSALFAEDSDKMSKHNKNKLRAVPPT